MLPPSQHPPHMFVSVSPLIRLLILVILFSLSLSLALPGSTRESNPLAVEVPAGGSATTSIEFGGDGQMGGFDAPKLWSSSSPSLYTVAVSVRNCTGGVLKCMCKGGLQGKSADPMDDAEDSVEEGVMEGVGGVDGGDLDSVEVAHGFRSLHYDANDGFFLNKGK